MGTYYVNSQSHSIFRNAADSANLANEDADVTDHPTDTDFILCVQVGCDLAGSCSRSVAATSLKLQYNKDGGGTWYDVGPSSEIAYKDVAGLTNDATGGTARTAGTNSGCSGTVETVKDCEDGAVTSPAITPEYWVELKFGLTPVNAVGGVKYGFQVYSITGSAALTGTIQAEITIAGGATEYQRATGGSFGFTHSLLKRSVEYFRNILSNQLSFGSNLQRTVEYKRKTGIDGQLGFSGQVTWDKVSRFVDGEMKWVDDELIWVPHEGVAPTQYQRAVGGEMGFTPELMRQASYFRKEEGSI